MTDLIGPASAPNSTTTRPLLYRVFGTLDTWFKDCSTPASQDGTAYQADFFNGVLGQMRRLIRGNGNLLNGTGPVVTEDNTSDAMMLTAVQLLIARGQPNAGVDTGSADALAVGPATPWPEYVKGARIWVIKSAAAGPNATAAPTLAVSNLAPVTIVRRDGTALLPGDLPAGVAFAAEHDGTYFRLVSLTWGEIAGAVQSGKWLYGAATGTGNAATVTLFPSQAPIDGTEILVKWPGANTAAAPTFLLTNFFVRTVVRQGGGTIQPGDLSGYVPLIYDASLGAWRVNGFVASDIIAFILANASVVYVTDTSGTTNTIVGTASPAITAYRANQLYIVTKDTLTNTGAVTMAVSMLPSKPVLARNGAALQAGDIIGNEWFACVDVGSAFVTLGPVQSDIVPIVTANAPKLTGPGNPTVYVRSDGNDSNNGASNDAAHAFATPQGAIDAAASTLALTGKTLQIVLATPTAFAGPVQPPPGVAVSIAPAPGITIASIQGLGCLSASGSGSSLTVTGPLTLYNNSNNAGGGAATATTSGGGSVALNGTITLSGAGSTTSYSHLSAFPGSSITVNGGLQAPVGYNNFMTTSGGNITFNSGSSVTVSNGAAFNVFASAAGSGANISAFSGQVTFGGTNTGKAYSVVNNASIQTNGGGANFFPGNTAGTTANGGSYT